MLKNIPQTIVTNVDKKSMSRKATNRAMCQKNITLRNLVVSPRSDMELRRPSSIRKAQKRIRSPNLDDDNSPGSF